MHLFFLFATLAASDSLGQAAFGGGQYREAKQHFERALGLAEDAPAEARAAVIANLGQACQALGEFARAEQLYRQALDATPGRAPVWHLLGGVLTQQRRFDEAEDALRRATALPDAGTGASAARSDLALILAARGKRREAVDLLEQAIAVSRAGQPRARMLANLGELLFKLGQRAQAVAALQQSVAEMEAAVGPAHPDMAEVLRVYGGVLHKSGRKGEAKDLSKRAEAIRSSLTLQTNANRTTVDYRDLK